MLSMLYLLFQSSLFFQRPPPAIRLHVHHVADLHLGLPLLSLCLLGSG